MSARSKKSYSIHLYEFVKDIPVVCPICHKQAMVKTGAYHTMEYDKNDIKMICVHCGFSDKLQDVSHRVDPKQHKGQVLIFGEPIDPFFHQPLWLQINVLGEILWAYNLEHLSLLEEHIGAKLRERNQLSPRIKSVGARLPRWMVLAKHRKEVMNAIQKLKEKDK